LRGSVTVGETGDVVLEGACDMSISLSLSAAGDGVAREAHAGDEASATCGTSRCHPTVRRMDRQVKHACAPYA
jgi:hypothetical protein